MVTHDLDTLGRLATHVAVLAEKRIVNFGPSGEVLSAAEALAPSSGAQAQRKLAQD